MRKNSSFREESKGRIVIIFLDIKYLGKKCKGDRTCCRLNLLNSRAPGSQYGQKLLVRSREKKIRERKGGGLQAVLVEYGGVGGASVSDYKSRGLLT